MTNTTEHFLLSFRAEPESLCHSTEIPSLCHSRAESAERRIPVLFSAVGLSSTPPPALPCLIESGTPIFQNPSAKYRPRHFAILFLLTPGAGVTPAQGG